MAVTRRRFLRNIILALITLPFGSRSFAQKSVPPKLTSTPLINLYRALNGTPAQNLTKIMELMGGIEGITGPYDVVVIKPNVQWWNQGVPNLSALNTFVDLIMDRAGGFDGEVVIAENCHRGLQPWEHAGWHATFSRNSDLSSIQNFNDLSNHLKKKYGDRFSTCHWVDVDSGNNRVFSPAEGTGYVYCDGTGGVPLISFDNGGQGDNHRAVIMSYPVFKTDRGTVIDFKNGIWEKGAYTKQPLKFINFAALNHHSTYCGATSAVKNYLGISDLSGGADPFNKGKLTGGYYNFHSFPFNKWSPGPKPGMLGAEIAVFMNTVRKADLNITTAEWVGMASRTEPPVAHTRAVLASKDPVALDYHATKYILFPNSKCRIHSPDDKKSPLHQYLAKCSEEGGGIFDEQYVEVKSHDFRTKTMQKDDELTIKGTRHWGTNPKMWGKYLALRGLN